MPLTIDENMLDFGIEGGGFEKLYENSVPNWMVLLVGGVLVLVIILMFTGMIATKSERYENGTGGDISAIQGFNYLGAPGLQPGDTSWGGGSFNILGGSQTAGQPYFSDGGGAEHMVNTQDPNAPGYVPAPTLLAANALQSAGVIQPPSYNRNYRIGRIDLSDCTSYMQDPSFSKRAHSEAWGWMNNMPESGTSGMVNQVPTVASVAPAAVAAAAMPSSEWFQPVGGNVGGNATAIMAGY